WRGVPNSWGLVRKFLLRARSAPEMSHCAPAILTLARALWLSTEPLDLDEEARRSGSSPCPLLGRSGAVASGAITDQRRRLQGDRESGDAADHPATALSSRLPRRRRPTYQVDVRIRPGCRSIPAQ